MYKMRSDEPLSEFHLITVIIYRDPTLISYHERTIDTIMNIFAKTTQHDKAKFGINSFAHTPGGLCLN